MADNPEPRPNPRPRTTVLESWTSQDRNTSVRLRRDPAGGGLHVAIAQRFVDRFGSIKESLLFVRAPEAGIVMAALKRLLQMVESEVDAQASNVMSPTTNNTSNGAAR